MALAGIPVIDADRISRVQAARGGPAFDGMVGEFGDDIVGPDGEIDREALAGIVFRAPDRLAALNRITHGLVMDEVNRRLGLLADMGKRAVMVEAALLVETGWDSDMDGLVVVTAPRETRIERVVKRDGVGADDVKRRIDAQMSQDDKAKRARWIIGNDSGLDELRRASIEVVVAIAMEGTL